MVWHITNYLYYVCASNKHKTMVKNEARKKASAIRCNGVNGFEKERLEDQTLLCRLTLT